MSAGQAVRPLDPTEQAAFRLARLVAAETMPYFMHGLFAANPVAAPGLATFAVDRHWRLYVDPALLVGPAAWPAATAAAVLLHEVGHLLRDHAGRADALAQPNDHLAWNLAGDAEINDDLLAAGAPLPEGVVTPEALGCNPHGLAETYYAALTGDRASANAPDGQEHDDGGAGCGSGAGTAPVAGELPAEDADAPGIGAAEADLVRRRVAEDVQAHTRSKGRGTMPAGVERWAEQVLAPPTISWDRVLRAAVRRAVANRAGRADYTYARPSRRQVPGLVKPAMRGPAVRVSIVVDTSGSMSQADLDAAMSEVQGVLRSSGVAREHVLVLACDAATATPQRVRSVAQVRLSGGGGTDMRVGIDAAVRTRPAPHVVVVLTDGDTPWPDRPVAAHLICGVISTREPHGTPAWATTVHIPPAA